LDYIEACVEELHGSFPAAHIILAGDFNELSDENVAERTELKQVVRQPTRGGNILGQVCVSNPLLFSIIRVVMSVVRSNHKGVVAFQICFSHTTERKSARFNAPFRGKHALFLQHVPGMVLSISNQRPAQTLSSTHRPSLTIFIHVRLSH
jgi:hypothetical protein